MVNSRDPERTRQKILDAATEELARYGLGGARVDRIAARAGANKRMLYYYFKDKDNLFLAALEGSYARIRAAERALELEHLPPPEALARLVQFTWDYFQIKMIPRYFFIDSTGTIIKAVEHLKERDLEQFL